MEFRKLLGVAAISLMPLAAGAAPAATAATAAPEPVREIRDDRWSLWPMAGGIFSDASDLDHGWTAGFKATRPVSDHFAFSGGFDYSSLATTNAKDYNRISGRAGLEGYLGTPYYDSAISTQPFVGLGLHVSSIDFIGQTRAGYGPYGDAGIMQRLTPNMALLLQGRYQLDYVQAKGPLPKDTFYTWQAMVGLRIALGEKPYDHNRDSDHDGVPDAKDKCPNTPKGVAVDANGCPLDTDGDGVPDYLDKCPRTPPGVSVNADGCPLDADGDGVPDYLDKCPSTPRGVKVDANGCPSADTDGDGVPDYLDKCPNTPPGTKVGPDGCPLDSDGDGIPDAQDECPHSPAGAKVLPNGCALKGDCRTPRPNEQVDKNGCAVEHNFILKGVNFEFDSDRLTEDAKLILNQVGETLQAYPEVEVDVEGHTDFIGTDAYNLGLSEKRAKAVKAYLTGRGVKPGRMTPIGYGKSRPIDSNETEEGREKNRRVELKVKSD